MQSDYKDSGAASGRFIVGRYEPVRLTFEEYWRNESTEGPLHRIAGDGLWFFSAGRGRLYKAVPERLEIVSVADNPEPVTSRCLAASPSGLLGADTD
ncbi:hypothetical protein [Paenibacillus eucommiae]|uniref:Uncharacterized protein n=1 Tax=Paenibacillus eucommiae TaxID=1355755 RepID=A0ABS4ITR1_9BACL|nr:hypothetical protein [Paenibacillus eucommiae]MBP1990967.1 hypothetical protein [Paenibacillus eucommiae]